jgi:hypothetical protein
MFVASCCVNSCLGQEKGERLGAEVYVTCPSWEGHCGVHALRCCLNEVGMGGVRRVNLDKRFDS